MARRRQKRSAAVEELCRRMAEWRQSRTRRTRIPEPFWEAATGLARSEGVHAVAKALGLKHVTLKARVAAMVVSAPRVQCRRGRGIGPKFASTVEVSQPSAPPVIFVQLPPVTAAGPVVELVDARGATLTIRFAPGAAADVGAVVRAFLGQGSA
jgi:hypothetical protein